MLRKLIELFANCRYNHFVFTKELSFAVDFVKNNNLVIDIIDDARSATFFAYGEAKLLQQPVVLVVDVHFLTHCYTGLTEAWFQQVPLIVVSVAKTEDEIYYDYLQPCLHKVFTIKNEFKEFDREISTPTFIGNGPILINLIAALPYSNSPQYEFVLDMLNQCLTEKDSILFYGSGLNKSKYKFRVLAHEFADKYGMISKYVGYIQGDANKSILVIPLDLFCYDANIFNCRYINEKFKLIILREKEDLSFPFNWLENNHIICKRLDKFSLKEAQDLVFSNKPMAVFLDVSKENA